MDRESKFFNYNKIKITLTSILELQTSQVGEIETGAAE